MEYILVHNSTFDNELYQLECEDFFEGSAELIMYFDDSLTINGLSKSELMNQEPWTKRPQVQPAPESSINVAIMEQF